MLCVGTPAQDADQTVPVAYKVEAHRFASRNLLPLSPLWGILLGGLAPDRNRDRERGEDERPHHQCGGVATLGLLANLRLIPERRFYHGVASARNIRPDESFARARRVPPKLGQVGLS
jgi:hypothetical protein